MSLAHADTPGLPERAQGMGSERTNREQIASKIAICGRTDIFCCPAGISIRKRRPSGAAALSVYAATVGTGFIYRAVTQRASLYNPLHKLLCFQDGHNS